MDNEESQTELKAHTARLSRSQKTILMELWEHGSFVHFSSGLNAHYFESGSLKRIRGDSINKLIKLGFLDCRNEDWRGSEYYLSNKAKNLLRQ